MDLNKDIVTFVLLDYSGDIVGRYNTLEELKVDIDIIVNNDIKVNQAEEYLRMVKLYLYDTKFAESAEEAILQLKKQVRHGLFPYGINKNNDAVVIEL